ncbi:hypothetical protein MMC22_008573 [Lobaria immixta]|nr:hypothetical protein [Lobaria immixta]
MYFSALLLSVLLFTSLIVPNLSMPTDYAELEYYYPGLPLAVDVVHEFPPGTWLDSLAVRRNGNILTTALSSPELFEVDNRGKDPIKLVHTFANETGCTGITQMGRETFYVIAGNFSLSNFTGVPGSWSVYKVKLHRHLPRSAQVSLVAKFPDSIVLNGITVLSKSKNWLLVSDSAAGVVYRLDVKTGKIVKVLEDPLMKPESPSGVGVNGIRLSRDKAYLFFTNSDRNIVASQFIDWDGTLRASAKVIADVDGPDDFTFNDADHVVVVQNRADRMGRVTGRAVVTLASAASNGTASGLFGPTAVRFGEVKPFFRKSQADWMKAYISTNGGTAQYLTGNVTRGGTISVVDVRGYW